MTKNSIDVYDTTKKYSSAQLKEHYKHIKKVHRTFASIPFFVLIPATLILGLMSWGEIAIILMHHVNAIQSAVTYIDFLVFAACGAMYIAQKPTTAFYAPLIMTVYTIVKCLSDMTFHIIPTIMCLYFILTVFYQNSLAKEILFMRTLPQYPFYERDEANKKNDEICRQIQRENPERTDREAYSGDEKQTEKLMDMLPKRNKKAYLLKRNEFDDPDEIYGDDLSGRKKMSRLEKKYSEKYKSGDMDNLNLDYSGDITGTGNAEKIGFEEINSKFKGDIGKTGIGEYAEIEDIYDKENNRTNKPTL